MELPPVVPLIRFTFGFLICHISYTWVYCLIKIVMRESIPLCISSDSYPKTTFSQICSIFLKKKKAFHVHKCLTNNSSTSPSSSSLSPVINHHQYHHHHHYHHLNQPECGLHHLGICTTIIIIIITKIIFECGLHQLGIIRKRGVPSTS